MMLESKTIFTNGIIELRTKTEELSRIGWEAKAVTSYVDDKGVHFVAIFQRRQYEAPAPPGFQKVKP